MATPQLSHSNIQHNRSERQLSPHPPAAHITPHLQRRLIRFPPRTIVIVECLLRRHAAIDVRANEASLGYHKEGHWFPEGGKPDFSVSPADFLSRPSRADYPIRRLTEDRVEDEFPELEPGTEEHKEMVDDWYEEEVEVFWNMVNFQREIDLREELGIDHQRQHPDILLVTYE
jgi:hypothetical protein